MKAIVRNPEEGDIFVKDLDGKYLTLEPNSYEFLGLCERTFSVVIKDEKENIYIAQSIDFDYEEAQ